jgi:hypothetical protein
MPIASSSWPAVRSCARVDGAPLAAQPFAVQQVGTGQVRAHAGLAEPAERLPVQAVGGFAVAQQRPAPRLDPSPQSVRPAWSSQTTGRGHRGQPGVPGAGGGLDQLGQRPHRKMYQPVPGGLPGRRQRVGVAAQAVIQDGGDPAFWSSGAGLST